MSRERQAWARFFATVVLLAGAAVFLEARKQPEPTLLRKPFEEFPRLLGDWQGRDSPLDPDVRRLLGPGDFLLRLYRRPTPGPPLDLFVAYFASQRTGDTIHSPQNCLPGAGWTPLERGRVEIGLPDGRRITVNRYVIGKGLERQMVLYWYQAHGRAVASEYWAKFYLVADAIRTNRSDGSLVRIITPVGSGERLERAEQRAVGFAEQILPLLDSFIPN